MADEFVSYDRAGIRGMPAFESTDYALDSNLLAGAEPRVQAPTRILLADSLTLEQFTVVGLNASNKLVKAFYDVDADLVTPIGVLLHAATSGVANTTIHGEVLLTGCFNAGESADGDDSPLVWDASWDTLAKKVGSVVGNPNLQFRSRRATGSAGA
jgi:hypothetical protein